MEQDNNKDRKKLPSKNFSLDKQIQILKAIAIIHQTKGTGSNYKDLAKHIGASPTNVSEALQFWKQAGVLENSGRDYIPSSALTEFNKQIQWGDESVAWAVMRDALKNSWFMESLKIKFQIKNPLSAEELFQTIGSSSGNPKKDSKTTSSVNILIDLLEKTNLVKKGGDGNYTVGELIENKQKEIKVEEDDDMIQVSIGSDLYAIDSIELRNFVTTKGRKLSKTIQRVE